MGRKPVVLLPACNRPLGDHPFHMVGRKYVEAVRLAGALPMVVPRITADEVDEVLALAHGVLLTGSKSNVDPSHFGEDVLDPALPLDPERDAWTLPLIHRMLAIGMPFLAICRGLQEANVAMGGTLHQAVQDVPGHNDHRADGHQPVGVQYGPSHPVDVVAGGVLEAAVGARSFEINSLHGQGVNRLANGLRVEAVAPDGVIEAFSFEGARAFSLCVQWHPEWQAAGNPVSMRLLRAFGDAVRRYRDEAAARVAAGAALA